MNGQNLFVNSTAGRNFQDVFSATSPVPSWVNVSANQTESKQLMNDINGMLSEVRQGAQSGGAKKRKTTKKGKKMSRPKKTVKKAKKATTGKKARKSSTGKKGKKSMKGGEGKRQPNEYMQKMLDLKKTIKSELPDLKDGIPMTIVASQILKKNDRDLDASKKYVKSNSSSIKSMYNDAVKDQEAKRAAKKASK